MDFRVDGVDSGTRERAVFGSPAPLMHRPGSGDAGSESRSRSASAALRREALLVIERARIGDSREVPVEIVVNGEVVARQQLIADGKVAR